MLNGVIEGTLQHDVCPVLICIKRERERDRLLVSRDRDSRPLSGFNRKSMVCDVINNGEKKTCL